MSEENKHEWNIYQKLAYVQHHLKAPKSQFNKFGNYKYRNLEDIQEASKPLLDEVGALLTIRDRVLFEGGRFYIEATAIFVDCKDGNVIDVTAYAREADQKKGMDASQVTGATSSYARKYALNGLFAIDDTKDADSQDNRPESQNQNVKAPFKASDQQLVCYRDLLEVERNNPALFDPKELDILHAVEQKNNEGGWNWVLEMHGKIQDRAKELSKQSKQEN